jgi:hypothetical protein
MAIINGIDLLYIFVGLVLLFVVIEAWDRYSDWFEWDRDRRRKRKLDRLAYQEKLAENRYRVYLRGSVSNDFVMALNRAARSIEKFGEVLRGETRA